MLEPITSLLMGVSIGIICGTCLGICGIIRKYYIYVNRDKADVENITKNILHTLDEENGSNVNYMIDRPIV
jgi:hypothetical protein